MKAFMAGDNGINQINPERAEEGTAEGQRLLQAPDRGKLQQGNAKEVWTVQATPRSSTRKVGAECSS